MYVHVCNTGCMQSCLLDGVPKNFRDIHAYIHLQYFVCIFREIELLTSNMLLFKATNADFQTFLTDSGKKISNDQDSAVSDSQMV